MRQLGRRIESVATAGDGTNLAVPKVTDAVGAQLAKNPDATEEVLVPIVAQQNNPNEAGYGAHVWAIYERLYRP